MTSDDVLSQIAPWRRTLDGQRGIAVGAVLLLVELVVINGAIVAASLGRNQPAELDRVFGQAEAVVLVVACSAAAAAALGVIGALLSCFLPDPQIARWTRVTFPMICVLIVVAAVMVYADSTIVNRRVGLSVSDYAIVFALPVAATFVAWMTSQSLLGRRFGVPRIGTKVAVYCVLSLLVVGLDGYVHSVGPLLIQHPATLTMVKGGLNLAAAAVVFGGYLAIAVPIQNAMSRSLQSAENRSESEPLGTVDRDTSDGRRWEWMRRGLGLISAGTIVVLVTVVLTEMVLFATFVQRVRPFDPPPGVTSAQVLAGAATVVGFGLMAAGLLVCCGAPHRDAARSAYLALAFTATAIAVGAVLYAVSDDPILHAFRSTYRFVWIMGVSAAGTMGIAGFVNGVLVASAMARAFGATRVGLIGALYIGAALAALTFAFFGQQGNRGGEADFKLARSFDIIAAVVVLGGILVLIHFTRSAIRLRDAAGDGA